MAPQQVYKNVFQGNTYVIRRWHAKHYAFGCIAPSGAEVWSGYAGSMSLAMQVVNEEMTRIATAIDSGTVAIQGPFLDPDGKEIPQ